MPTGPRDRPGRARSLLDQRLLIVTGKGGVGKSTVAGALAWMAAAAGKRVLACEIDAKGDLARVLRGAAGTARTPGFAPVELHRNLFAMTMDPEASLKEYLRLNLRIPLVARIGVLSSVFDFVATAAPGVREVVTMGKVAYEVRQRAYDIVVVDAPASGHVVGLLRAPDAINELVGAGLIRSQTDWMREILQSPDTTSAVVVTTAEELAVTETCELVGRLRAEARVDVGAVVVNRLFPERYTAADDEVLRALLGPGPGPGSAAGPSAGLTGRAAAARAALGSGAAASPAAQRAADSLFAGVRLERDLRRSRSAQVGRLVAELPDVTQIRVAEVFGSEPGLSLTKAIAAAVGAEIA